MNDPDIKGQRDQALSCLILATAITLAVFLSVYGNEDGEAIDKAKSAVAIHENLLREASALQQRNQDELNATQATLLNLARANQP